MLIFLGSFYIFLGCIFLLIPLIYLELGRPRDLIKATLNLLVGITLIIKNNIFNNLSISIYFSLTSLIFLYVFEIFLFRWNQLTDEEKNKLLTPIELKNNILKIFEGTKLGINNLKNYSKIFNFDRKNENIDKKKWVRNDKNDNIKI